MVEVLLINLFCFCVQWQITKFLRKFRKRCFFGHLKVALLEVLLNLGLESFMIFFDSVHEDLENLVRRATLMFWVHHVEQAHIILIVFNESSPFGFVRDLASEQFGSDHVAKLHSICPFFHSLLFFLPFLVAFLGLHDVLGECVYPIEFGQFLVALDISKQRSELIPLHIVLDILLLQ